MSRRRIESILVKVFAMNNWKKIKVSDIGRIITGKTPKTAEKDNYGGDIPFLTPSDDLSEKYVYKTIKNITEKGMNSVKGAIIPASSVCVSCIGSDLGKVVITTKQIVTNQQINSIVVNKDLFDTDFVYYSMLVLGRFLNYHSKTSTAVPIINKSTFSNYEINCPDLKTQRKIGNILACLDSKIDANKQINDNLLQQASALYKSYFIDMLPFNGIMPSNWHVGTVSEITTLHDSKRIPLSGRERANLAKIYPYYGATSIMDYVDKYLFDGIYLLLGEDGSVIDDKGFPILQYVDGKFWVNNHAHIITGKNGFSVEMLYLLFSLTNVQSIVTGAVQPKISQSNLNKVNVVIPSQEDCIKFDSVVQPFFAQIRNLRTENSKLSELRDSLLPRLMSGEFDVSDIDI